MGRGGETGSVRGGTKGEQPHRECRRVHFTPTFYIQRQGHRDAERIYTSGSFSVHLGAQGSIKILEP